MAYQNVGTPRFYVNYFDWLSSHIKINSLVSGLYADPWAFRTLPVKYETWGWNGMVAENSFDGFPSTFHNFLMILGHNLASNAYSVSVNFLFGPNYVDLRPIINGGTGGMSPTPQYDGFSLWNFDLSTNQMGVLINFDGSFPTPSVQPESRVGSIIIGRYYDMPHSPELKLTMTREMDGVKKIRTKGGVDLVDHKYTKPPMWGNTAPWEIGGTGNQSLSRVGRRSWDLSFNYLDDGDVFGSNQMLSMDSGEGYYETGGDQPHTISGFPDSLDSGDYTWDGATWSAYTHNLLTDDNFYSQVIHKTNGGQLPFIFQPDNSSTAVDNFAICKIANRSLVVKQVANGVYSINLKIREVW